MAKFGDWLNLVEHIGFDSSDKRTVTIFASKIGMEIPNFSFAANPFYVDLKILYMKKKSFELKFQEILKSGADSEQKDKNFLFDLVNAFQLFYELLEHYANLNLQQQEESQTDSVNYSKSASDFIHSISEKDLEKIMEQCQALILKNGGIDLDLIPAIQSFFTNPFNLCNIPDGSDQNSLTAAPEKKDEMDLFIDLVQSDAAPESNKDSNAQSNRILNIFDIALNGLHRFSIHLWKEFLTGFIQYSDYLVNSAARKKVDGKTMNTKIVTILDNFIMEFLSVAEKRKELEGLKRFKEVIASFVDKTVYAHTAQV
jgi:hypothetical protein